MPAVIAGGAVRDLLLGRTVKDVDIWTLGEFTPRVVDYLNKLREESDILGNEAAPVCAGDYINGGLSQSAVHVGQVWDVSRDGTLFNIIEMKNASSIEAVVSRFDFGICRAWVDMTGRVAFGADFARDYANSTFTLLAPENGRERSLARFTRLAGPGGKYAGWTLIDPEAA